jgi:hypothetical protein
MAHLDIKSPVTKKCVVVTGSPRDGFTLEGPFNTIEEASRYAEEAYTGDTWWIDDVIPPTNSKGEAWE